MTWGRLTNRQLAASVLALTVLALGIRFLLLGHRIFHWDEARVGYWTLRYAETGIWTYRPIVHGPLLFHVNAFLFDQFGASDLVARSLVAIVGGTLPLAAWLLRSRLSDFEVLGMAAFLALEPTLLYYSRFMRNDLLVAGFAVLAVALFVRFLDTGRHRYVYGAVLATGLGLGTKEIAVIYPAIWIGALALLFDRRLLVEEDREIAWYPRVRTWIAAALRRFWDNRYLLIVGLLELLVVIVILYAPRPDLSQALANPAQLPGVVEAATRGSWESLYELWIDGGQEHSYVVYLYEQARTLAFVSLPLTLLAVFGFLHDRYTGGDPRDIVAFPFYWAGAVFFIYPAITDISAPWALVHALVPLSVPAAVGLGILLGYGIDAWESADRIAIGIAVLVGAALVLQVGGTAYATSYDHPQADSNPLVQYAQPSGEMRETIETVQAIAVTNDGTDVLFYGEHFGMGNESASSQPPASGNWHNRLPLPWYFERVNAETRSTIGVANLSDPPPVVIARAEEYGDLREPLEGYEALTFEFRSSGTETIFFVDERALQDAEKQME
ncbi:MAG: flippase activity-associated protein Agl23 [Halodesulfurarchaeum sp.]